jgi:branched-chain amino acid transport system substrate-binding protein
MKWRTCAVFLAANIILLFHTAIAETAAQEKYRIGLILPLSGDAAMVGSYCRKSVELAYSTLPQASKNQLELFWEDDQWQSARSVSAYHKLVDINQVDAVLVVGSDVGQAIAPLAELKKKIMVAIGASDHTVAAGRQYAFLHWVIPETQAELLVKEIKKRDYKSIALAISEQRGCIAQEKAVLDQAKKQGIAERIISSDRILADTRDFRTIISKLRAKRADAVFLNLIPGPCSAFARQGRDFGLKAAYFGMDVMEDENEVKASDGALVGAWYVNAADSLESFRRAYQSAYNEYPGWASSNSYDVLNLLAEGVKRFGKDNDKIADYLRTLINYHGAAGIYSATGDNRFTLPAAVKIVTKERFEKPGQ